MIQSCLEFPKHVHPLRSQACSRMFQPLAPSSTRNWRPNPTTPNQTSGPNPTKPPVQTKPRGQALGHVGLAPWATSRGRSQFALRNAGKELLLLPGGKSQRERAGFFLTANSGAKGRNMFYFLSFFCVTCLMFPTWFCIMLGFPFFGFRRFPSRARDWSTCQLIVWSHFWSRVGGPPFIN